MNIKHGISYGISLLLPVCGFLQACQQDLFDGPAIYDKDKLIAEGRYLTARSADAFRIDDVNDGPQPFDIGTPYRLFAFAKPYDASNPGAEDPVATYPRFNKVASENETDGGLRFLNIDSEPSKWFGFTALGGETKGSDGLVSLDFYGFTYGVPENIADNYIPVDGWREEKTQMEDLTRTETIPEGGTLRDLMRGVLLNQNISTAGVNGTEDDGNQIANPNTQSVIPFNHCFSKMRFQVSQQARQDVKDEAGNSVPCFDNLVLENIEVTGTYRTGTVELSTGKVTVADKIDRALLFNEKFSGDVTLNNTDVGEMVIFPSDGSALGNPDLDKGYKIGLKITVKSTDRQAITNMLTNTGSPVDVKQEKDAGGVIWYRGTIIKEEIKDYYTEVGSPDRTLYFKQNTSYMLIITFQDDAVRIITVIPIVEEWLPGEGTPGEPWQEQAMGQPQMFDNIVWSDRNLGADHFDATGNDYEKTVGYFYQAGRNIPYYPFKWGKKVMEDMDKGIAIDQATLEKYYYPDIADIRKQDLANGSSAYKASEYAFYPVVDSRIRKMHVHMTDNTKQGTDKYTLIDENTGELKRLVEFQWLMWPGNGQPQMYIPETMPTDDHCVSLVRGNYSGPMDGLKENQDMHWEKGQHTQPVSGAWVVPSSKDFLTIFPSTPHAGNITFRVGADNSQPMEWYPNAMSQDIKVLRVTVPYYVDGMNAPAKTNASAMYTTAWNTLKEHEDEGCTTSGYWNGPGSLKNPDYEPDGDPEDGSASVYLISREGDDLVEPEILQTGNWAIRSWGTVYAIKNIYSAAAYRMRWRVVNASKEAANPCFYVEICRYRCRPDARLTAENYKTDYDWEHPAAKIYFPICGLGDWTGEYINFGTECQYATSDKIEAGKTSAVQMKVTGNDGYNAYIAVVRGVINRNFGMQIRPREIVSTDQN